MTSVLHYDDLDMSRVDAIFDENGEILISLPPNHASALISFIEVVQITQSWSKNHTPLLARLAPLAKGLLVILHITIKHSRLIDLGRVIVLKSTSQTCEKLPDGYVLFRCVR